MIEPARTSARSHPIAGAFVFLLLGVFALFSAFMVLLSAQFYRGIVEETDIHGNNRVLANYVINSVHGNDAAESIYVDKIGDIPVLAFIWSAEDDGYQTLVYCYEGSLMEYFGARNEEPDLSYGEVICPAQSFVPSISGQLLEIEIAGTDGEKQTLHIALHTRQEVSE